MREQYPFFRDADERTLAVIGEEAADSDLNGTYQKPYAILSDRRLYCKNEGGNFIAEAKTLKSAKKTCLPGQNWFLWGAVVCVLLSLALLCICYWGWGARGYRENVYQVAQRIINRYHVLEEMMPEYEEQINTYEETQKLIEQSQKELEELKDSGYIKDVDEAAKIAVEIAVNQSVCDSIPYKDIQSDIQWFEDSKETYQIAQSVQRKIELFTPFSIALAVAFIALLILTLTKQTKLAIFASLGSGALGAICVWTTGWNALFAHMYGYERSYDFRFMYVFLLLFVLGILLSFVALWWDRKKTAFQIIHTTGSFHFTPSLYPAAEFRNFTAQVEGLKAEEKVHA